MVPNGTLFPLESVTNIFDTSLMVCSDTYSPSGSDEVTDILEPDMSREGEGRKGKKKM